MKTLLFKDYQSLAKKTLAILENKGADVDHMILGMITESGEISDIFKRKLAYKKNVDTINLKEEIGDLCWYLANLLTIQETSFVYIRERFDLSEKHLSEAKICIDINAHIYAVSKYYMYQNQLHTEIENIIGALLNICNLYEINLYECLYINIMKLKKRYPDGFNEVDALVRDVEEERKVLESTEEEIETEYEEIIEDSFEDEEKEGESDEDFSKLSD